MDLKNINHARESIYSNISQVSNYEKKFIQKAMKVCL